MSAAIYATDGGRCGVCGHTWAELPPPGDEFHRQVIGQRVTDGCAKCRTPDRQPCAGWVDDGHQFSHLDVDMLHAGVGPLGPADGYMPWRWTISPIMTGERLGPIARAGVSSTSSAAQLAAEDALLAVADEIRREVGR